MDRASSRTILLLAVLAVAGGSGMALSGKSPPPEEHPETSKARRTKGEGNSCNECPKHPPEVKDPFTLLERFVGATGTPPADKFKRAEAIRDELKDLGYSRNVGVLLATLPDPQDSRFARLFDDMLSAVRIAIERVGYVDDRFFDPWRPDVVGDDQRPLRREQPTTLIFRSGEPHKVEPRAQDERSSPTDERDLLVLLVVGESPAWGVHRGALTEALDFAATMLSEKEGERDGKRAALPILGPTLSGTAESLRLSVARWFRPAPKGGGAGGHRAIPFDLNFISGTATSDRTRLTLGKELSARVNAELAGAGGRAAEPFVSSFAATVQPDSAQQAFSIEFLAEQLGDRPIALLSESSTAYGQGVGETSQSQRKDFRRTVIRLPFPLHISKLRSQAERERGDTVGSISDKDGERPAPDDEEVSEDAYPAKSADTQAVSDVTLEQTLRTMATEEVQGVVVAASSTSDALFLVRKVREAFPSVTIVLSGADLAYLKGADAFMNGVLISSTYPLLPWTQRLEFPFTGDESRMLFPSEAAEGAYNATGLLLAVRPEEVLVDYGAPFLLPRAGQTLHPPLWMTTVRKGTFWPVSVCSEVWSGCQAAKLGQGYLRELNPTPPETREAGIVNPKAWGQSHVFLFRMVNVLLVALDLFLIVGYWNSRVDSPASPTGWTIRWFAAPRVFPHAKMQRCEVASLLLIAFLVSVGFLAVDLVNARFSSDAQRAIAVGGAVMFALVCAGILGVAAHAAADALSWPKPWGGAAGRRVLAAGVALGVAFGMLIIGRGRFGALWHGGAEVVHATGLMLFVERARNLDSGVSLLSTALLIGVGLALWTLGNLRQVRIAEDAASLRRYGVIPPTSNRDKNLLSRMELLAPIKAAVTEAEGVLPKGFGLGLTVFTFLDALWISRRLVLFEYWGWGIACAAGYALLLALVVYACSRYLRTWRALEDVLAKVAPLGVTRALERIPTKIITSFKRPWDAEVFEVWMHHCQRVLGGLKAAPELIRDAADELGMEISELQKLLEPRVEAFIGTIQPETTSTPKPGQAKSLWEDFLAMRLVAYVHYIRTHLANFVAMSTAVLIIALWVTNFYPLSENRFLLMLVLVVTAAAVAIAALVSVQMSRNYVLSKIDRTPVGEVSWDGPFVTNLFIHVALPVLALLAVKFPELGHGWSALTSALSSAKTGGS